MTLSPSTNPNGLKNALPNAGGGFSIQTDEIFQNSIVNGHLAAGTITAASIAAGTITATQIASGTITSTQVAANLIQTISVPVPNASVVAAYDTPYQIIAGVTNKTIVLVSAVLRYVYGVHAFTSGGVIQLQYGNTAHAGGTTPLTTVAAAQVLATASSDNVMQVAAATVAPAQGAGIFFSNATADFAIAGGNTSSVTMIVQYYVV